MRVETSVGGFVKFGIKDAYGFVGCVGVADDQPGSLDVPCLHAGDGEPVDRFAGERVVAGDETVVGDEFAAAELADSFVEEFVGPKFVSSTS